LPPTQEIVPGIFHFTQVHELIKFEVSSYYLYAERVLFDPMTPPEGIEWFDEQEKGPPTDILLSCRHHYRHAADYVERYRAKVHCVSAGLHEFEGRDLPAPVEPFEFGAELPGGVIAKEVDAISPDETAFYVPARKALLCADGAINFGPDAPLSFVPDQYMDDPPETKRGLIEAYRGLLELDFEHLLLAHGAPVIGEGKRRLAEFVEAYLGAG
jgi:glyoxylase-like metal-dependent hydrolase (beta-lactamase superfamily II)